MKTLKLLVIHVPHQPWVHISASLSCDTPLLTFCSIQWVSNWLTSPVPLKCSQHDHVSQCETERLWLSSCLLPSSSSVVRTRARPLETSVWSHSSTSGIEACDLDHEVQINCVLNQIKKKNHFPQALFMLSACESLQLRRRRPRPPRCAAFLQQNWVRGSPSYIVLSLMLYKRSRGAFFFLRIALSVWHRLTSSLIFLKLTAQHSWKSFSVCFSTPKI